MTRSALEKAGIKSRSDHVSDRVKQIVISPIKEIAILAAEVPGAIPFAWGIPFIDTPPHIREALKTALDKDPLIGRYSPSAGLPQLREVIAAKLKKKHGVDVDWKKELLVTTGAMEGLMAAILAVVNPGDEVIITSPGFSSYTEQVMLAGGVPRYLPLDESKNWAIKLEELPKLINKKTKMIMVNSPCNPTGSIFSQKEIDTISEAVLKHNLILLTDEPYDFLTFDGERAPSFVGDERLRYQRISCFSFSKEYAMTGYRVGYAFAEAGMIRQMMKVHDATLVSAPRPSQVAALAALTGDQSCVEQLRLTLQKRRNRLCGHLDKMTQWFSYVKPHGTYYVFPKFLPPHEDIVQVAIDILYGAKIAIVPGSAFGPEGNGHLRFCFGCTEPEIDQGMDQLHEWLKINF